MKANQFILLIIVINSCGVDENRITTDLVNSPFSADPSFSISVPEIYMYEESYDFGKIIQGQK